MTAGNPACVCGESGRHFCTPRADRAQAFFERVLVHTKGRYARTPFILDDWQRDGIIRPLFGTVEWSDEQSGYARKYDLAWIELARKNGKSELLSGIALYMLCADDEESAEVYSVASDTDQAALVFNVAKRMVELSPVLSKRLELVPSRRRILDVKTNSVYAVLPGDASGALGTNPSAVLFDEILTQKDRHLWDAMRQGFGTRAQPLMVAATTASYTSAKFCLEEHEFSARVLSERLAGNDSIHASRFVFMRNTPREWDWTDEGHPAHYNDAGEFVEATGWYWANPALGSFLSITTLRNEAQEAAEKPTAQNAFRVFRLNQWVSQATRWLDLALWRRNGGLIDREKLKGRKCFAGLDLASSSDFTAWVLLFPHDQDDGYDVLPRFWLPASALEARSEMRSTMEVWQREGLLSVSDGDQVSYAQIQADIERDAEDFRITMIGYDPWNAPPLIQSLEGGGLIGVKAPQTTTRLNQPSKELERLLKEELLNHGGNPVLEWMADNVEVEFDASGNFKPSKRKSGEKIDGIAALVNALFVSLLPEPEKAPTPGIVDLGAFVNGA